MIDVDELATWILVAVGELGGTAKRADVLRLMERLLGSRLKTDDLALRPSGQAIVWKNKASFARNQLIEQGLLHSMEISGHGIWSLTSSGARESSSLRSRRIPALCPTFRSIATDVIWRTQVGRSVGLVPGETTFTDNALLHLAISHPADIAIQRFTSKREAETGADWEWWIRDLHGYVGFRTQAKRAHPRTGRIGLDQRAAPSVSSGYQVEVFVERCVADGIAGLYCVYSDGQPAWRPDLPAAGPCPHGPVDIGQWGCTFVLAETALRLAFERCLDVETVLAAGTPWYHLVCHHPVTGLTPGIHHLFSGLKTAEMAVRDGAEDGLDRQYSIPPPATQPPGQVEAYFLRELRALQPWSDLAGVVMIDATEEGRRV
ncbi:winged helix-turn-helix domain-containing protein [Micromonospora sp. C41]|uniref:winged helix-turn-helix domain-containing protein n=1 Tax=Micromonospora sp. C41 TaxID=2824878 RepID=UPI001B3683BE|nr:winged helix-turn-helix domain-containing protein [Micromonospora sp. C41]MBQ1062638.1 winged helix-turn-helix domain-containing protein [Micromonospora sp. C41]